MDTAPGAGAGDGSTGTGDTGDTESKEMTWPGFNGAVGRVSIVTTESRGRDAARRSADQERAIGGNRGACWESRGAGESRGLLSSKDMLSSRNLGC